MKDSWTETRTATVSMGFVCLKGAMGGKDVVLRGDQIVAAESGEGDWTNVRMVGGFVYAVKESPIEVAKRALRTFGGEPEEHKP